MFAIEALETSNLVSTERKITDLSLMETTTPKIPDVVKTRSPVFNFAISSANCFLAFRLWEVKRKIIAR
jgi:hypothetical protein